MKKINERAFTLVELLVVVGIVGLLAVAGLSVLGIFSAPSARLESVATTYASKMGWEIKGVSCMRVDTDGDGYQSCTLALADGSERSLLCSYSRTPWGNQGCKIAPLVNVRQTRGLSLDEPTK